MRRSERTPTRPKQRKRGREGEREREKKGGFVDEMSMHVYLGGVRVNGARTQNPK